MISIISLNCYDVSLFSPFSRRVRLQRLVHELLLQHADIYCLQEITFFDTFNTYKIAFQRAGYHIFPETCTQLLVPGGLLTATRLPIISCSSHPFIEQGSLLGLDVFERITTKCYQKLTIHPSHAPSYTIINTHLHCPFGAYTSKRISNVTKHQIEQLLKEVPITNRTILAGDLNVIPTNRMITSLLSMFNDSMKTSNEVTITNTNTHRRFAPKFDGRIDYILLSKDIKIKKKPTILFDKPVQLTSSICQHLSDHFGIAMTIA